MSRTTISNRTLVWIFSILCIFFVVGYSLRTSLTPDSYLHLGIGRYVVSRHTIPGQNDISYKKTQPSLEWISHSWLFDTLAYISISPNEFIGPLLLLLPSTLVTFFLLHILLSRDSVSQATEVVSLTIATIVSLTFWKIHPLLFALPLFLVSTLIVDMWRRKQTWSITFLPVVTCLFANVAGGYILIFALFLLLMSIWYGIGLPFLCTLIDRDNAQDFPKKALFLGVLSLSFFTSLLNPYGFRIYLYGVTAYALLGRAKWYSSLAGALEVTNTSIFKTNVSPAYYVVFLVYFLVTVFLFLFLIVREKKKFFVRIAPLIPLFGFFWLGFFFIRFIPLATFTSLPLFAVTLDAAAEQSKSKYRHRVRWVRVASALSVLALSGWYILNPRVIVFKKPESQCAFIRDNNVPPNILISTELTGYIYYCLFPQKQQIDARDDFFDANDTIGVYGELTTITDENIKSLVDDNEINAVLTSKENDYVTTYFNKKAEWSLVYLDYNGLLFVRNSQVAQETLDRRKLRYVDLSRNLGFDPQKIVPATQEMKLFSQTYPQNILAIGQLASMERFNSNLDEAEATLLRVPKKEWGFELYTEMGRIQAAKGNCSASEKNFLQALQDRGEQNVTKTVLDVAILYAGCFHNTSKASHYFQRYISYPLPGQERERAIAIAKQFGIDVGSGQ